MEAQIKELSELVKSRPKGDEYLKMNMLSYAGKKVYIKRIEHTREGQMTLTLRDDRGYNHWRAWMFADLPAAAKPVKVKLGTDVAGNHEARVYITGAIQIGCAQVPFDLVEKLYKTAVKTKEQAREEALKKRAKVDAKTKRK